MKRLIFAFLALCVCHFISIDPVHAQELQSCKFCFRGKPKPDCCSFLIFETGWMFNLTSAGDPQGKDGLLFTADLGVMFNRQSSNAWGGSFHIAENDDGTRFGLGPRYRKWLNKEVSFDFSPRLMFGSGGGGYYPVHRRFPGFAFSTSISFKDLISFDSYYQILPYYTTDYNYNPSGPPIPSIVKGTETGLYLGISGRSYFAPVTALIGFVAVITVSLGNGL